MSTVDEVIAGFKVLADGALPSTILVLDGAPTKTGQRDYVVIGDVKLGLQEYRQMAAGKKPRNETYEILVDFVAVRPGSEQTEARTAAIGYWQTVMGAVATDPKIGLGATLPALMVEPGPFEIETDVIDGSGYRTVVTARLRVQTRLGK